MRHDWGDLTSYLPGLLGAAAGLIVILGASICLIVRLRAQYRSDEDPAALDHAILSQFGELRRQGHLSEEEFRSIKGRLVRRLDGSIRAQDKKD